jgi:hypothetical protein
MRNGDRIKPVLLPKALGAQGYDEPQQGGPAALQQPVGVKGVRLDGVQSTGSER